MSLFLLNISVDTADFNPNFISEDLSLNDQESIIEIIVEQVLGYEDAFMEYDDNDREDHHKKTNLKIELIAHHIIDLSISQSQIKTAKQKFPNNTTYIAKGFHSLYSRVGGHLMKLMNHKFRAHRQNEFRTVVAIRVTKPSTHRGKR